MKTFTVIYLDSNLGKLFDRVTYKAKNSNEVAEIANDYCRRYKGKIYWKFG